MYIVRVQDYIEASYVTGPTHNTLWLRLSNKAAGEPIVNVLPPRGELPHEDLNSQEILQAIAQGIVHANALLRTNYHLAAVQYLADDSPRYIIYSLLAHHITIFTHAEHLQDVETRTKVFEIITTEGIDKGRWRVAGRAWSNIRIEDVLFAASNNTIVPFEVAHVSTYNHEVPELGRMLTGELVLLSIQGHQNQPDVFLYR